MLVFWGMRSNFDLLITSISNYVHLNYQANFTYIVKGIFLLKSNVLWFLISLKKWIKSVVNSNSNNINNLDVWNKYRWQPQEQFPIALISSFNLLNEITTKVSTCAFQTKNLTKKHLTFKILSFDLLKLHNKWSEKMLKYDSKIKTDVSGPSHPP